MQRAATEAVPPWYFHIASQAFSTTRLPSLPVARSQAWARRRRSRRCPPRTRLPIQLSHAPPDLQHPSLGIKQCVNEVGVGFMMSANYHPAMKIVRPVRRKFKIKTVSISSVLY